MKEAIKNHYILCKKRGLITPETTFDQFVLKIDMAYLELCNEYADIARDGFSVPSDSFIHECTKFILTITDLYQHFGICLEDQIKARVKIIDK